MLVSEYNVGLIIGEGFGARTLNRIGNLSSETIKEKICLVYALWRSRLVTAGWVA